MPKPIRVMIEVERIKFGDVFVALDAMEGVASITPIGDGPRAQREPGRTLGKRGGAQSAECIVLGVLADKGQHLRSELSEALTAGGRKPGTISTIAKGLVDKKHARVVSGAGTKGVKYAITPAGIKRYETACTVKE